MARVVCRRLIFLGAALHAPLCHAPSPSRNKSSTNAGWKNTCVRQGLNLRGFSESSQQYSAVGPLLVPFYSEGKRGSARLTSQSRSGKCGAKSSYSSLCSMLSSGTITTPDLMTAKTVFLPCVLGLWCQMQAVDGGSVRK